MFIGARPVLDLWLLNVNLRRPDRVPRKQERSAIRRIQFKTYVGLRLHNEIFT